jgi:hypothetical protein
MYHSSADSETKRAAMPATKMYASAFDVSTSSHARIVPS